MPSHTLCKCAFFEGAPVWQGGGTYVCVCVCVRVCVCVCIHSLTLTHTLPCCLCTRVRLPAFAVCHRLPLETAQGLMWAAAVVVAAAVVAAVAVVAVAAERLARDLVSPTNQSAKQHGSRGSTRSCMSARFRMCVCVCMQAIHALQATMQSDGCSMHQTWNTHRLQMGTRGWQGQLCWSAGWCWDTAGPNGWGGGAKCIAW